MDSNLVATGINSVLHKDNGYYTEINNSIIRDNGFHEFISKMMDRYGDIDLEGEYFLKKIDDSALNTVDKIGWIILEEFIDSSVVPITLESIPEAWCGVEFKISVYSFGTRNLILGSPELIDYPIDREELVEKIKEILSRVTALEFNKTVNNGQLYTLEPPSEITWISNNNQNIFKTNGVCCSK